MGKNTGKKHRKGAVTKRSQTFTPLTGKFVKRDTETGRFMACKATPFKGVKKEKAKVS